MSEQDAIFMFVSFVVCALCAFAGYHFGYIEGRRIGRDEQWTDDFISRANADRARRDKAGRFTPKKSIN